ncbi:hypothetical protein TNCV_3571091 [Trichonephila clavipes]|nr:hypothetical protein TNCV_3571091 [Trichonephila clavipes]
MARLDPQVQDYVEGNSGFKKNYYREKRDWDRRRSRNDRKSRNQRDAEVFWIDKMIGENYRNTYTGGIDPRGTKNSRTETGLTGMIGDSRVVADGISSGIGVRVTILTGIRKMVGGYPTLTVRTPC